MFLTVYCNVIFIIQLTSTYLSMTGNVVCPSKVIMKHYLQDTTQTKRNQTKPNLMYLHNILFTVQSVLEVLALCFQLLNFTSTQLSSIPKSCWGSVILWLCARLVKRLLIQLATSKLCNLKSSFLYYFKIHLIVSCKKLHVKEEPQIDQSL